MIRDAIKMKGLINYNPFEDFDRGSYQNPVKLGIELEHCNLIEPICTREDVPVIVRRVASKFLLMCYSGLRFEDAMSFDPDAHVIDNERIVMKTQKAGVALNMKLYNRLSKIIELLGKNPLPLISNQEFNKWLKVVGNLAGLGHLKLTCHVGRHTFGGLLAEMEIPEEQAQKLLAHKDIRSTRVYYHVKAKNLDNAMDKMNGM
jgi:integrase